MVKFWQLGKCLLWLAISGSSGTVSAARPGWIDLPEATLREVQIWRVSATGATSELCREELQRAIEGVIDRQIVLAAEVIHLPKELESQIWPEQFDPSWMDIEEYYEPVTEASVGEQYRGWARIHFLPKFTQALSQRVVNVRRVDRLRHVGVRFAATLLAIAVSFGYLQSRQRRKQRRLLPAVKAG